MKNAAILFCFFWLVASTLMAVSETEPNNYIGDTGVIWCENGTHIGSFMEYTFDMDYWRFECYPGDQLTINLLSAPPQTVMMIVDANNQVLAETYAGGSYLSELNYTVPDETDRYLILQNLNFIPGPYTFSISGQFIGLFSDPLPPSDFSIADGSINVDVNTTQLTWRWGDGCFGGSWNIFFGVDPYNLQPMFMFNGSINVREGSYTFPVPLAGNLTYYYAIYYSNVLVSYTAYTPLYHFVTAPRPLPVPITENFDGETNIFLSVNPNSAFFVANVEAGNPYSIINPKTPGINGQIVEIGTHDLSATTGAYMTFRHLCLMEPEADHGYVEYSLDGGVYWSAFPISSYLGSGVYDFPSQNNPMGPCFDAGSYSVWAGYQNPNDLLSYWQTETFDLSPWAGCQNFRIRFYSDWNDNELGVGWVIDDFGIYLHQPGIPHSPNPSVGTTGPGSFENLGWIGINSSSYEVMFGSQPGTGAIYPVSTNSFHCNNLEPSTTYFWKVRGINSVGVSDWSQQWSFTTQPYRTTHHLSPNLYITHVNAGSISNPSVWTDYTYYSGLTASVNAGSTMPITAYLAGGYGPEAVRVWVDINRDNVFNNEPGSNEYWDFFWNGSGFSANINIPAGTPTSYTRMRIQCIHTTDGATLNPTGILPFGETEDYVLHIIGQPLLSVTPASGNFPATLRGFSSDYTRFTFANIGSESLDITLTGINGTDADCFTLTEANSYPIHLSTNQASVDIRYQPLRSGTHSANLLVRDNLTRTDTLIPLSGTAIDLNTAGAVSLDGSGEFISLPSGTPLQTLAAVTLETWFKWTGNNSIQFVTAKAMEELEIHTTTSNGLRFIPTDRVYLDSQPNVLVPNVWQHLACVYNPANQTAKIYVDGVDVTWQNNGTNPLNTPLKSTTADFRMGLRQDYSYALAGCLDEVRIWNTALSLEHIRNNMHLWQSPSSVGLISNLRLDEASGGKAWDQISGITATLINTEPADRIESHVLIGQGVSATAVPSALNIPIDFPGTGMQMTFTNLETVSPVTVTLLNGEGNRQSLDNQSWVIHTYDNGSKTANLQCALAEDIVSSQLPAHKFRLFGRNPFSNQSYQLVRSAELADTELNLLYFNEVPVSTRQLKVQWDDVPLPETPTGLVLSSSGSNVNLSWTAVSGAIAYHVFSATNPEGPYFLDNSGSFNANTWTAPASNNRKFFRIKSVFP